MNQKTLKKQRKNNQKINQQWSLCKSRCFPTEVFSSIFSHLAPSLEACALAREFPPVCPVEALPTLFFFLKPCRWVILHYNTPASYLRTVFLRIWWPMNVAWAQMDELWHWENSKGTWSCELGDVHKYAKSLPPHIYRKAQHNGTFFKNDHGKKSFQPVMLWLQGKCFKGSVTLHCHLEDLKRYTPV